MYLSGKMTIDPADLTNINRVKPSKGFRRLAHFLTMGGVADEVEEETFFAATILQQINMAFRAVGVTNIIRLASDDTVYYEDNEGREDDFKDALVAFGQKADVTDRKMFEKLSLVLEHSHDGIRYLIEILISRVHKVGEHPIVVTFNGMLEDFAIDSASSPENVRAKLADAFQTQDAYDALVARARSSFDAFLTAIENAFGKQMKVDNVTRTTDVKIVRPQQRVKSSSDVPNRRSHHDDSYDYYDDDPIYRGYYGYDNWFFYGWFWSEMVHDHDVHCSDCSVVNEFGDEVIHLADTTDAHEAVVFDPDTPMMENDASFDDVGTPDLADATDPIADSRIDTSSHEASSGGWLSSFFGGDESGDGGGFWSDFGGGDSSCGSSCGSSCSSCGGGCGGD